MDAQLHTDRLVCVAVSTATSWPQLRATIRAKVLPLLDESESPKSESKSESVSDSLRRFTPHFSCYQPRSCRNDRNRGKVFVYNSLQSPGLARGRSQTRYHPPGRVIHFAAPKLNHSRGRVNHPREPWFPLASARFFPVRPKIRLPPANRAVDDPPGPSRLVPLEPPRQGPDHALPQ